MVAEIRLSQMIALGEPRLIPDDGAIDLRAQLHFKERCVLAGADVLGVALLDGFDARAHAWKRKPKILFVRTDHAFSKPNLMLLFRQPVRLPPLRMGFALQASLPPRVGREGLLADAVTVTVDDPAAALATLCSWGVPAIADLRAAMAERFGLVDGGEGPRSLLRRWLRR
ncbi:MAG: hypothetical protein M3394_01750 [Actinomycetota bacterium]|nr:hypothetical protein [Actinomycetota bacterium]